MTTWTHGQILDRLIDKGIIDPDFDQHINAVSTFNITGKGKNRMVRVFSELRGMGHNEPASYGTRCVAELNLAELMENNDE